MFRGRWRTVTVKFPASPSSPSTSARVINLMLKCRPHSISLGDRMHREQSLVGKVLFSWALTPPIAGDFH